MDPDGSMAGKNNPLARAGASGQICQQTLKTERTEQPINAIVAIDANEAQTLEGDMDPRCLFCRMAGWVLEIQQINSIAFGMIR